MEQHDVADESCHDDAATDDGRGHDGTSDVAHDGRGHDDESNHGRRHASDDATSDDDERDDA